MIIFFESIDKMFILNQWMVNGKSTLYFVTIDRNKDNIIILIKIISFFKYLNRERKWEKYLKFEFSRIKYNYIFKIMCKKSKSYAITNEFNLFFIFITSNNYIPDIAHYCF